MRAYPLNPPRRPGAVRFVATACACVLIGLLGAGRARAASPKPAKPHSPLVSRNLWATIDICSSAKHQDTVGIRGSMPGTGVGGEQMFMRFRVQFLSSADHLWHYVTAHADSGYQPVGFGRFVARQSGWSFTFHPPAAHGHYTIRGVVGFQWRQKARILLDTHLLTTAGHTNAVGAQPKGYSAATCSLH